MSKSKNLLIDIGVTIVVFIVAVLLLGYTNYRNNSANLGIEFRQLHAGIVLHNEATDSSVVLLQSGEEATTFFPTFNKTVDWKKEIILSYTEYPLPTSGYTLETTSVTRQGPQITINYKLLFPPTGSINLTVLTQPTMFIAINRTDLASSSQLTIRFHNEVTQQTTSLSISPDEIR